MPIEKKSQSKVLDRSLVELTMDDRAGKVTRKEAVAAVAQEMGVAAENVALIRLDGQSGTRRVRGKFYVYGSAASMKKVHPSYLDERSLSMEEREKL